MCLLLPLLVATCNPPSPPSIVPEPLTNQLTRQTWRRFAFPQLTLGICTKDSAPPSMDRSPKTTKLTRALTAGSALLTRDHELEPLYLYRDFTAN